jgi:hypothetical protein
LAALQRLLSTIIPSGNKEICPILDFGGGFGSIHPKLEF